MRATLTIAGPRPVRRPVHRFTLIWGIAVLTGCMSPSHQPTTAWRLGDDPAPVSPPVIKVTPESAEPTPPPQPSSQPPQIVPDGIRTNQRLDLTVNAPARRQIGGNATYRLTLRNTGDQTADDVSVSCEFDEKLMFAGSDERHVLQRVGRLLPGETKDIALSLLSRHAGTHCCRFSVRFREADRDVEAVWKSVCVEFVPQQLQVDVRGPSQRTVGSRAEFNLRVSNQSSQPVADVHVTVTYDAALIPREATQGAAQKSGSLTWNLGTLKPREGVHLQVEFECHTPVRRACLFIETAGTELPEEQAEACVEIVPVPGILDLRVSDRTDPLEVGKQGAYEITVQNIGLQAARQVRLEVLVPPQLKPLSATVSQGDQPLPLKFKQDGDRLLFDPIDPLAPDARVTFVLHVEALRPGEVELRATLSNSLSKVAVSAAEPTSIVGE